MNFFNKKTDIFLTRRILYVLIISLPENKDLIYI